VVVLTASTIIVGVVVTYAFIDFGFSAPFLEIYLPILVVEAVNGTLVDSLAPGCGSGTSGTDSLPSSRLRTSWGASDLPTQFPGEPSEETIERDPEDDEDGPFDFVCHNSGDESSEQDE
jgi:hypothetical protein